MVYLSRQRVAAGSILEKDEDGRKESSVSSIGDAFAFESGTAGSILTEVEGFFRVRMRTQVLLPSTDRKSRRSYLAAPITLNNNKS